MTAQSPHPQSGWQMKPADPERPEKPRQSFARRMWEGWIKPTAVVIFVVATFRSAVADWNDVPSQSMEPTILIGDRIVVNKLAYDLKVPFTSWAIAEWSGPKRGDIVVFFSPASGQRMVKRVIGLPGDVIELRENRLLVNGTPIAYEPLDPAALSGVPLTDAGRHGFATERIGGGHTVMIQPNRPALRTIAPLTVPADHFYVLGDNRDNSGDSRVFGPVQRQRIAGRAVAIAFSLDKRNNYRPRWGRFFRGVD